MSLDSFFIVDRCGNNIEYAYYSIRYKFSRYRLNLRKPRTFYTLEIYPLYGTLHVRKVDHSHNVMEIPLAPPTNLYIMCSQLLQSYAKTTYIKPPRIHLRTPN